MALLCWNQHQRSVLFVIFFCVLLLFPSFIVGRSISVQRGGVVEGSPSPLVNPRFLQEEETEEITCEFVDTKWLERLIEGHETFAKELFGIGSYEDHDDNNDKEKQGRVQTEERSSRSTTLLANIIAPSFVEEYKTDRDTSSLMSSTKMLFPTRGGRFSMNLTVEDGSGLSLLLEGAKTRYRINPQSTKSNKMEITSSSLLSDEDEGIRRYVNRTNFWGVAVSGKYIQAASGKKTRYQALVLGADQLDSPDDSTRHKSSDNIFLFVDKQSAKKTMKKAKQDVKKAEKQEDLANALSCPSQEEMDKNKECRNNVGRKYRIEEEVLKGPFQASLRALDEDVNRLDEERFNSLYKVAAACATAVSSSSSSHPIRMLECIDAEKPRLYESFLVSFGALKNDILSQTVARNINVEKLKLRRNADLQECCTTTNENEKERRRRGQQQEEPFLWIPFRMSLFPAKGVTSTNTNSTTPPIEQRSNKDKAWKRRRLEGTSTAAANTCQFIPRVNETELAALAEFPEDLFRRLTASTQDTAAPADTFVTKGYNTGDTKSQELKIVSNQVAIEVRKAKKVELDVAALIESRNDVPRAVKRFVRDETFEATVVEGSQKQEDGSKIEFVGVVFSRTDRKKQLIWPVSSGILGEILRRRRRRALLSLSLEELDHFVKQQRPDLPQRRLQTVNTTAGTVTCTATQTQNETCAANARENFTKHKEAALSAEKDALDKLDEKIAALHLARLEIIMLTGAECASKSSGGWEVVEIFVCLLDKAPSVTREYLTNRLEFDNAVVKIASDTSKASAEGRLERDEALVSCCDGDASSLMNGLTQSFSPLAPSKFPSTSPSEMPLLRQTRNPSVPTVVSTLSTDSPSTTGTTNPTKSPSNQPTKNPSATPTVSPSASPMSDPTCAPTSSSSRSPRLSPTKRKKETQLDPTSTSTKIPTFTRTRRPTSVPPTSPTNVPSTSSTSAPGKIPTSTPSTSPKGTPSTSPTSTPGTTPTSTPSTSPTSRPAKTPTSTPSTSPTSRPAKTPTSTPTTSPTSTPTTSPTSTPTTSPTSTPTTSPSSASTTSPSRTPTTSPSRTPTTSPSSKPTTSPSRTPTTSPSSTPTTSPSSTPTTSPSSTPTTSPTNAQSNSPSNSPSTSPTLRPTYVPSKQPTVRPSSQPTFTPSTKPTKSPSSSPTVGPTRAPTVSPTAGRQTQNPSSRPTLPPAHSPTANPMTMSTTSPSASPTFAPATSPTSQINFAEGFPCDRGETDLIFERSSSDTTYTAFPRLESKSSPSTECFLRMTDDARVSGGVSTSAQQFFTFSETNSEKLFETKFEYRIHGDNEGRADGLTFVMHQDPGKRSALGGIGGYLGVYAGISKALVIEMDTFENSRNPLNDAGKDNIHVVKIESDGTVQQVKQVPIDKLRNGFAAEGCLWIKYCDDKKLEIFISADTDDKPTTPVVAEMVDLGNLLDDGNEVTVGFTSATGGHADYHDIMSWTLKETCGASGQS